MSIAIKVENLSKCYQIYENPHNRLLQMLARGRKQFYKEFWALKDVSFEVKKGETVGIIGRNGSGKSTLLQLICGTLNPTSGSIQTSGRIAALLELGSGFNPEFTGRENVYMNASVLGLTEDEINFRFDDIAAFADIGDFIDRAVKTYSSGMFVRLAFAVQAMVDPEIFVVDEALAVGDEKFQRKCFSRLETLKNNGTSILFVSHSSGSIIELCERTLLLEHGNRLMFGSAAETIKTYQKLIYASVETQESLVQELLASDQSSNDEKKNYNHSSSQNNNELDINQIASTFNDEHGEYFDSCLIPETTIVYPNQGALIDSIQIINSHGRIVNLLQAGNVYHFVISGHFLKDFLGVFFGIHIKTISGVIITGQRFPEEGSYVEEIRAGQNFEIKFSFRMDLLPGVYFIGGGIWSNQEVTCVHRIIDASMFRVNSDHPILSFGYVNLMTASAVIKFEGSLL